MAGVSAAPGPAGRMVDVASGMVSPVFTGQEGELAVLAGAFEAAAEGTPATVLVGAEEPGAVSPGWSQVHADGDRALVLARLRGAERGDLPCCRCPALELCAGRPPQEGGCALPGQAGRPSALLPEFGSPCGRSTRDSPRSAQGASLLEALADQRSVLLVVEGTCTGPTGRRAFAGHLSRQLRRQYALYARPGHVPLRQPASPARRLLAGGEQVGQEVTLPRCAPAVSRSRSRPSWKACSATRRPRRHRRGIRARGGGIPVHRGPPERRRNRPP